jgi:hypothetical protein
MNTRSVREYITFDSSCATGVSSGLAIKVTLIRVSRGRLAESITQGWIRLELWKVGVTTDQHKPKQGLTFGVNTEYKISISFGSEIYEQINMSVHYIICSTYTLVTKKAELLKCKPNTSFPSR